MFEDDEQTIPDNIQCEEQNCQNDAIYRCTPDADYPVPEGEYLEVCTCAEHINVGLSYPMSWPGPPKGWRVEFLDVIQSELPN